MPDWIPLRERLLQDIFQAEERLRQPRVLPETQIEPIEPTGEPIREWASFTPEWIPQTPQVEMPQMGMPQSLAPQKPVTAIEPLLKKTSEWYEMPKVITEKGMEALGKGISKVPVLPEVLEWAAPAFEFIHEKLEKPWAATLTAPFSPEISWRAGESWMEHQKREYEMWKAPTYWKGVAEFSMPLWWMPWLGWAGKGVKGMRAAAGLEKSGQLLPKLAREIRLPLYSQWESQISNGIGRKIALWSETKLGLGPVFRAVGGRASFIRRNPQTLADKAKNFVVYRSMMLDKAQQIGNVKLARLYEKLGGRTEVNLLKLAEGRVGVVKITAQKPGLKVGKKVSYELDDVITHPELYEWTDKAAHEYVKVAGEMDKFFTEFAQANGVKVPHSLRFRGQGFQHITRLVEGKLGPEGFVKLKRSTDPFERMVYETALEGVENGVKYYTGGMSPIASRIELYRLAIARRVSTHLFDVNVKQLGKTVLERLEEIAPELMTKYGAYTNRVNVLNKALVSLKGAVPTKGLSGRPVSAGVLNTLSTEFPELASHIAGMATVQPKAIASYLGRLSKSSQLILEKNKKPLIEALLAQPQKTSYYDTIEIVSRFTRSEQKAIRIVDRIYRQSAKAELNEYKSVVKSAVSQTDELLKHEKQLLTPIKEEMASLRKKMARPRFEYEEAIFKTHPAFRGRVFDKAVVDVIQPSFIDAGNQWLKQMAAASGVSRMTVAALDLSAPFIQGLMAFGTNPVAWAKSVGHMFRIAKTPSHLYRELVKREVSRMDRILYGGSSSVIDFFEAMPILRRLGRKVGGIKGEKAVVQTYGRAEMAFLGFSEITRDELWKVGRWSIGRKGLSEVAQEAQLRDLARSLDRMTGVMSSEAIGIGLTQRQVESAWVFFAPRYTRAGASFIGDALKGGITGAEARKALAGTLLGGTTMYMGACAALGQTPNLNAHSARFMTVEIGGRHIGVGGFYYATMRLMANILATAKESLSDLRPDNLSRVDNPFYRFLYSRTAPLTGLVTGLLIEHKDYLGQPFESGLDYLAFMADKVIPIALQPMMPWDRKPWQETPFKPTTFAAEMMGMRTFPQSSWEVRDQARDNLALNTYGISWDDLTRAQQREIESDSPILIEMEKTVSEQQKLRGDPQDILFNRRQDELDFAQEKRDSRINLAAAEAERTGDFFRFKEVVSDIENDYGAIIQHITEDKEYASVVKQLEEWGVENLSEKQRLDVAHAEWAQYRYSKTDTLFGRMVDAFGEPLWENIEKLREHIARKYGNDALQYIEQERPLAGRDLPPLYLELRKAKQSLRPYWKVKDELLKIRGKPKTLWQVKRLNQLVKRLRKRMRQSNPEMNRYFEMFYTRPEESFT